MIKFNAEEEFRGIKSIGENELSAKDLWDYLIMREKEHIKERQMLLEVLKSFEQAEWRKE